MRSPFLSVVVLVACSVVTAAAHADTFNANNLQPYSQSGYGSTNVFRQAVSDSTASGAANLDRTADADGTLQFGTLQFGTLQLTGEEGSNAGFVSRDQTTQGIKSEAPESSSLLLLGTGLLGAAGMARRRLFAA